jgi:hypothetical protein
MALGIGVKVGGIVGEGVSDGSAPVCAGVSLRVAAGVKTGVCVCAMLVSAANALIVAATIASTVASDCGVSLGRTGICVGVWVETGIDVRVTVSVALGMELGVALGCGLDRMMIWGTAERCGGRCARLSAKPSVAVTTCGVLFSSSRFSVQAANPTSINSKKTRRMIRTLPCVGRDLLRPKCSRRASIHKRSNLSLLLDHDLSTLLQNV